MNVAELEAEFRDFIDDEVPEYRIKSSAFLRYLNDAQRKAVRSSNLLIDSTSSPCKISVLAGKTTYKLNPAIYGISSALLNDNGVIYPLIITDRTELDRVFPNWRTETRRPQYLIHDNNTVRLAVTPDKDYPVTLEVYRYPEPLESIDDEPEINEQHHIYLIDWCAYRALSKPDTDVYNPQQAQDYKLRFENYFGCSVPASARTNQFTNVPHHNKTFL